MFFHNPLGCVCIQWRIKDFERGGGGVSLSRTFFSTALVHAHEAGDACKQNDKKGGSADPRNPPGSATGIY